MDTVSDVGDFLDEILDKGRIDRCAKLILKCDEIYINGQTRLETFWRRMITDQTFEDYPAPPEIGLRFFQWLQQFLRQIGFKITTDDLHHAHQKGETRAESRIPTMPNLDALASSDSTGQLPSMEQPFEYYLERMQGDDFNLARDFEVEVQAAMDSMEHVISHLRGSTVSDGEGLPGHGACVYASVWVFAGAGVPFVLRRCGADRRYRFVRTML